MSLYNVVTDYLGKTLGCDPKSLLSCLRGVSAEKLQAITDVGNVEKNATDIPSFNYVMVVFFGFFVVVVVFLFLFS